MAQRKLQSEIDRTLKKVAEGVEVFEGIFEKIQTTGNQTQKEKLEADLKTQIKKLQRLRDQIKTWQQSNDIKDKQPLVDHRKLIETQMERFKACEKEMKTKAFSKEGLSAAAKLDPREQEKVDVANWITNGVDELSRQNEAGEAEIETLASGKRKKDSEKTQRLEELERMLERRNWHINRLELILRLLENGQLSTNQVNDIKEDVQYYVESNNDDDFDEDEGIYDDLNLEEEEDMYQIGIQAADDADSASEDQTAPTPAAPAPAAALASPPPATAPVPPPAPAAASAPAPVPVPKKEKKEKKKAVTETPAKATSAGAAAAASVAAAAVNSTSPSAAKLNTPVVAKVATPAAPPSAAAPPPIRYATAAANAAGNAAMPVGANSAPVQPIAPLSVPSTAAPALSPSANAPSVPLQTVTSPAQAPPPGFEQAPQRARRDMDLNSLDAILATGYSNIPAPIDADRPKHFLPKSPVNTPSYYPQEVAYQLATPRIFAKMDVDTLFYVFYYFPNTYWQYLAASELKKQSWRFHKQYLTWFQRANEPQTITEDYEQGVYLYFDWEGSWCQRRKTDFKFEYKYLETE